MPFDHVLGQPTAVATLERALSSGRVHHAYRFEGPDGVGKERAAFALAQALVCTGGAKLGCGECDACRRAVTLSEGRPAVPRHPDVILVGRNVYPGASIGRSRDEATELSVDQIRAVVLTHGSYAPHEGRARVFLIRAADELSVGAGNALLKTLEEPRPSTHFVLLTSRPERLLDTIRSRTLPVRFAPLPDAVVRGVLEARGIPAARHDLALELAAGSASAAIALCDEEEVASREAFAAAVLDSVRAPDLGRAVAFAEGCDRDKERLRADLRALAARIARNARAEAAETPARAAISARRHLAVTRAIARLDRNAQPTLAIVTMIDELRTALP